MPDAGMLGESTDGGDLGAFLCGRWPFYTGEVVWPGEIRLALSAYLSADLPPRRFVSSARAIVLRNGQVAVQRSVEDVHILPGGRLEAGESMEEALRREVLEETGWRIEVERVLGFQRLHHLTPKPAGYPYPYPDFFWVIYLARAVEQARSLGLKPAELRYLEAALVGPG